MLHDFRKAGIILSRVQRLQGVEVHVNESRHMERADHIFVGIKIYARLSADARIHLGEQGCRDLDKIDAAQIGRCSKAGHIADHTAAEGCEHVFAVKMMLN